MTTYDVPLWARPNRRDGRWNVAGRRCTQYFCLDPDSPYAEVIRHQGLRTEEEEASLLTLQLWEARLHEAAIVDYSEFALAEAAGFPPEALVDDDLERCQAEAEYLIEHQARGVLAPSAALPGATCLTLFGPRVEVPWESEPALASEVPVRRVGSKGPPPPGLVARVRHYGDVHTGLAEYLAAKERRRRGGAS